MLKNDRERRADRDIEEKCPHCGQYPETIVLRLEKTEKGIGYVARCSKCDGVLILDEEEK